MNAIKDIIGTERLIERFGAWPSFHDAEVVRLVLNRAGSNGPMAELLVHTWVSNDKVDERGYYLMEKHTLVRFTFEQIKACDMSDFNEQNVLINLDFESENYEGERAFRVTINPSYGLGGSIVCGRIIIADVSSCNADGQKGSAT